MDAFDAVWVATDSEEVADRVRGFGGTALLTERAHASGTDRVAEAAGREEAQGFDLLVNFQADEPFLEAGTIRRAIAAVRDEGAPIATLATPIASAEEWESPSIVKVARAEDGRALYFSRAGIPRPRDEPGPVAFDGDPRFLRHVGLYVYKRSALETWVGRPPSPLEETERLEQLRALEAGLDVHVVVGGFTEPGVDVPGDIERAARLLANGA